MLRRTVTRSPEGTTIEVLPGGLASASYGEFRCLIEFPSRNGTIAAYCRYEENVGLAADDPARNPWRERYVGTFTKGQMARRGGRSGVEAESLIGFGKFTRDAELRQMARTDAARAATIAPPSTGSVLRTQPMPDVPATVPDCVYPAVSEPAAPVAPTETVEVPAAAPEGQQ